MTFFKVSLSVGAMISRPQLRLDRRCRGSFRRRDRFESIVGDDCDGERCIAVAAVCSTFSTGGCTASRGNGKLRRLPLLSDHFQLSPANVEARFQLCKRGG